MFRAFFSTWLSTRWVRSNCYGYIILFSPNVKTLTSAESMRTSSHQPTNVLTLNRGNMLMPGWQWCQCWCCCNVFGNCKGAAPQILCPRIVCVKRTPLPQLVLLLVMMLMGRMRRKRKKKGEKDEDEDDTDTDVPDDTIGILPWDRVLSENAGVTQSAKDRWFLGFRSFQELRCPEFSSMYRLKEVENP